MKLKLKVLSKDDTPENCTRRVVIEHDENGEWCRDTQDCLFMLWSNSRDHRGDTVWDPVAKRRFEVDSPLEEIEDEEGCGTGEYRVKPGIIAFGVDVYEHSGTAWALNGEGGYCFSCPWDTARNAFYLYVDKERWESLGPAEKWEFVDGKPTEALLKRAREIARCEIREMNLCEQGCYYGYVEQTLVKEDADVSTTDWLGETDDAPRHTEYWDDAESCCGYLTDEPARDIDFPVGCPVVTDLDHVVGDEFEQECWAFRDPETGEFLAVRTKAGSATAYEFVREPKYATLYGDRRFPETNLAHYETKSGRKLVPTDVTEEVWKEFPECRA